jgi:hypothetical protein
VLCFASFEQNKHNNGGNYCGAEAWGQFWDIKEMRELGKKVNVANLNVTQAHSCSPFFSLLFSVFSKRTSLDFWQQLELNGHPIIVVVLCLLFVS